MCVILDNMNQSEPNHFINNISASDIKQNEMNVNYIIYSFVFVFVIWFVWLH